VSRRPEAHLGYGVVVPSGKLRALGRAAKAMALGLSPEDRARFDPEYLACAEIARVWNDPAMKPEEDFSVHYLLDGLGQLHGVALFQVPTDPDDYDSHDSAVVYRETHREQDHGYTAGLVLPETPRYDPGRLARFFALFGARHAALVRAEPRWLFAVTHI